MCVYSGATLTVETLKRHATREKNARLLAPAIGSSRASRSHPPSALRSMNAPCVALHGRA